MRELGDRRRLATAVDTDDEDHLRTREGDDVERFCDRPEDGGNFFGNHCAQPGLVHPALEPARRERIANAACGRRAEVCGDEHVFDRVERVGIEYTADEPRQAAADHFRRSPKSGRKAGCPAVTHNASPIRWSPTTPVMCAVRIDLGVCELVSRTAANAGE